MNIYLPWAAYAAAIAVAILYLQLLPELAQRMRFGFPLRIEGRLLWPCMIAVLALFLWPFMAAAGIEWDRRAPSVLSVVLMALGALALGWVLHMAIGHVLGAFSQRMIDLDAADMSEGAQGLRRFLDDAVAAIAWALLILTGLAYWLISGSGQSALCGGRCY